MKTIIKENEDFDVEFCCADMKRETIVCSNIKVMLAKTPDLAYVAMRKIKIPYCPWCGALIRFE